MNTEIINVVETINGIISQIQSFIIPKGDEEEKQIMVEKAEQFFLSLIKPHIEIDAEYEEELLDEGTYDDENGHEVNIIWANEVHEKELHRSTPFPNKPQDNETN